MLNVNIENEVFKLYEEEIDTFSFARCLTLLRTLIVYKEEMNIESYRLNNEKLKVLYHDELFEAPEILDNTIIIGGDTIFDEKYCDEIVSGFINMNLPSEAEKYKIYINPEIGAIHIYRNGWRGDDVFNMSTEHVFSAIISKIMPWHFQAVLDENTNENYKHCIEIRNAVASVLVGQDAYDSFYKIYEDALKKKGVIEKVQFAKMQNISKVIIDRKRRMLDNDINSKQSLINTYMDKIYELNRQVRDLRATIFGIDMGLQEYENPINELLDFIKYSVAKIEIIDVEDESIKFDFTNTLEHVDEDAVIAVINNQNSYLYEYLAWELKEKYDKDLIDTAYRKLLLEKEYEIYVKTRLKLNLIDGSVSALTSEYGNEAPHPHLNSSLSCFGNARGQIAEYITLNRYAEAMNQMLYAAGQFTVMDSAAGYHLVHGLQDYKCIKTPGGEMVYMDEFLALLKEEANND